MSIFKDTFKDYVKNQITTREALLSSQETRPIEFSQYVSAKSPWARMVSFVDYEKKIDLAKNYILYGGTLYQSPNDKGNPNLTKARYGIYGTGKSYGSDLSLSDNKLEYGIRPMPGIESISVRTISAYGSLRETTIKYYAWDLKQLQDLNILFMKPGYPVLVEWGWSLYLNNRTSLSDAFKINNKFVHIDAFRPGISLEEVYSLIKKYSEAHYGNYDASLGFIKNYSYTLLKNGGFECTTTLISMGDVISSIKMNGGISSDINAPSGSNVLESELNDEYCRLLTKIANNQANRDVSNYINVRKSYPVLLSGESLISNDYYDTTIVLSLINPGKTELLPGGDDRYTKFISFGYFIHVLNNYSSLYTVGSSNNNLINIEIPHPGIPGNIGTGYSVSCENALSINNDVCFIFNKSNKLIRDNSGNAVGFIPSASYTEKRNTNSYLSYYDSGNNLGIIANIYVNIGFLINTYKSMPKEGKGTVFLGSYLKKILSEIEFTLGSINNFDIMTIDNKCIIVDKHYVEPLKNTRKDSKFELSIMGLKTTVREHQVVSKIFEEQSTMVAIAAQDRENVASLQTSTMVAMNKNIYNRLYPNTSNRKDVTINNSVLYKNTQTLLSFANNYILSGIRPNYSDASLQALNSYLNQFVTVVDKGTDFKGIIPISLNVKMDGISGITIGEIFRINANVLPSEYKDKSVGFIVTGVDHEIIRSDWVTNLKTQFCLLDQQDKYLRSKEQANAFIKEFFTDFVKKEKEKLILQIHNYNLLISFLADFFNNRYNFLNILVNNPDGTKFYTPYIEYPNDVQKKDKILENYIQSYNIDNGNEKIIKSEIGKITTNGIVVDIDNGADRKIQNQIPLFEYVKDDQWENNINLNINYSEKDAIQQYLKTVIPRLRYYIDMTNPYLKKAFDEILNYTIDKYFKEPTLLKSVKDAISVYWAEIWGNYVSLTDMLIEDAEENSIIYFYIDPNSVDPYGNLISLNIINGNPILVQFNN